MKNPLKELNNLDKYLTPYEQLKYKELNSKNSFKECLYNLMKFAIIILSISISGWFILVLIVLRYFKYNLLNQSEFYENKYLLYKGLFLKSKSK